MKYYQMAIKLRENSTLLYQVSHDMVRLKTGQLFPEDFEEPFIAELDEDTIGGVMPTFFMSPAVIGTQAFYRDLLETGITNIEAKRAIIQDNVNNREYDNYMLLNIIGRVSCADMNHSDYHSLGEGMHIINKLVIDPAKTQGLELFLVHEDTGCIVVSERIHDHLIARGYQDIYFEAL